MRLPDPSLIVEHLDEPDLDFKFGQRSKHPKDGLFLHGPHEGPRKLQDVRIGAIGTIQGLKH